MELSDPKISQLDLAYHDIKRGRGVFDLFTGERGWQPGSPPTRRSRPPSTRRPRPPGPSCAANSSVRRSRRAATSPSIGCISNSTTKRSAPVVQRSVPVRWMSGSSGSSPVCKRRYVRYARPVCEVRVMAISKVERLMNLVIALLSTRVTSPPSGFAPTSRATPIARPTGVLPHVRNGTRTNSGTSEYRWKPAGYPSSIPAGATASTGTPTPARHRFDRRRGGCRWSPTAQL